MGSVLCREDPLEKEMASPAALVVKILPENAGDMSSTPGSARSPGKGNSNPLQYSCLENPEDRGDWRASVLGVDKELETI